MKFAKGKYSEWKYPKGEKKKIKLHKQNFKKDKGINKKIKEDEEEWPWIALFLDKVISIVNKHPHGRNNPENSIGEHNFSTKNKNGNEL